MTLTRSQNAELARRLDTLEKEARNKIRETMPQLADQKYVDLIGVVYDFGDEATASTQEDVDHTLLEHYLHELRGIEAVRARLANGEINCCVECGAEIGFKRLRAYPFAVRCIDCQTQHEKNHGGESAPKP